MRNMKRKAGLRVKIGVHRLMGKVFRDLGDKINSSRVRNYGLIHQLRALECAGQYQMQLNDYLNYKMVINR